MADKVTKYTAADTLSAAELLGFYEQNIQEAHGWSGGLFFDTAEQPAKEYRDLAPDGGNVYRVTIERIGVINAEGGVDDVE